MIPLTIRLMHLGISRMGSGFTAANYLTTPRYLYPAATHYDHAPLLSNLEVVREDVHSWRRERMAAQRSRGGG